MISLDRLKNSLHVTLLVDKNSFAQGSALYTFFLTQHKKVTLVSLNETIPHHFIFLPWYDKVRKNIPSSSDYVYEVDDSSSELLDFFKTNGYKINEKMAQSLYAGFVLQYHFFTSKQVDGTVFALASELIALGADHAKCQKYLYSSLSLSFMRVGAVLLQNMLLQENATVAKVSISSQELAMCGATLQDCIEWLPECMRVVHVSKVILVKSDENDTIIKTIKDIYIEKKK